MITTIISTKEIRNDLEGFLKRLKNGQKIKVMYRSKPLVTLAAYEEQDAYLNSDAGTPDATKRNLKFLKNLRKRPIVLDPTKSFKELYDNTKEL